MASLTKFLNELNEKKNINIKFIDTLNKYKFSELPLQLIFDQCQNLKLKLKGFATNQEDFDIFCSQISQFQRLEHFTFRFYNKRVYNLDKLFDCIKKIKKVELNLKNFKKITLLKETQGEFETQDLTLNLNNTTFKDKDSMNVFKRNLRNCQKLQTIVLTFNNVSNIELLAQKINAKMQLQLQDQNIDINFCNKLIEVKNKYGLENVIAGKIYPIYECYLKLNGFKTETYYLGYMCGIDLTCLAHQDFRKLNECHTLMDHISKNQTGFYAKSQHMGLLTSLIIQNQQYFQKQTGILFDYTIEVYLKGTQFSIKLNPSDVLKLKFAKNITNLIITLINDNYGESAFGLMKIISKFQYLINYQVIKPQSLKETDLYFHPVKLIIDHANTIQERSIHKLRYLVFQKTISEHIPFPKQVFYDLIEI